METVLLNMKDSCCREWLTSDRPKSSVSLNFCDDVSQKKNEACNGKRKLKYAHHIHVDIVNLLSIGERPSVEFLLSLDSSMPL